MKLLSDKELVPLIVNKGLLVKNLKSPVDWYSKDSPIQPSSVDLHIGNIYIPGSTNEQCANREKPLHEYILNPGHTAVVVTHENLEMLSNIAGIGFPPSRVSFQGILMTNPGHIDPGYKGPMHFTVINMGRQQYVLRNGDAIVTLLFFELTSPVEKDWLTRRSGESESPITQENLGKLCHDFMDIDRRALKIAEKVVTDAEVSMKKTESRIKKWSWAAPIFAAIVIFLGTSVHPQWKDEVAELKTDIAKLEEHLEIDELKEKVDILEERLDELNQSRQFKDSK